MPYMLMEFSVNQDWAAGWGTLSLVNAGLAQGKHRSGLVWFLLSLLLIEPAPCGFNLDRSHRQFNERVRFCISPAF